MASPPMDFPTRTPKDPMPVDPRTILAALVHLDHKAIPFGPYGCGFNGPFGPYGYSGNTLPPMALNRNITTPTNLTTLKHVKAVPTLTTKTEGVSDEFLMPKITLFNAAKGLAPHRATGRNSSK
ncbi:hypothetical protein E4U37_006059 [Claviceps purpurea]|nr:hypothetical protein E4U37_006059 [Claviceps purpurea]